jgi:hypothetical protein
VSGDLDQPFSDPGEASLAMGLTEQMLNDLFHAARMATF